MKVNQNQIDDLVLVLDHYATKSAHAEQHIDSAYKPVVRQYAKMIGLTQKEARAHLDTLIC